MHQRVLGVYVDGFNLYFGSLSGRPELKWLDLEKLARNLIPGFDRYDIHYFSAPLKQKFPGDTAPNRQVIYLSALEASGCQIQLGKFRRIRDYQIVATSKWTHLLSPNSSFLQILEWLRTTFSLAFLSLESSKALVVKYEEKGSDVNLATQLLKDSFTKQIDEALVISGDTDLVAAFRETRKLSIPLTVANPSRTGKTARQLIENADRVILLNQQQIADCQFPRAITRLGRKPIQRPETWA